MKPLRVPDALQSMASRVGAMVDEVTAGEAPAVGSSARPSAAAVSTGHAGVAAVGSASATRMQATSSKLVAAWGDYQENERQAARDLGELRG
ncbi:hypothetical protein BMW24_018995 [Mycobacterium heckeshornense]|uniref:Uncharacterized protein n=1 Tax=Mycobacterium heckeshornense TaxID=110505 RepID=A0A2G8B3D7_9MYCO|nr:hypothetical protein [Mycobacterium heckeshornense]KMV21901.1 hypothetical protein ACT16_13900 [Mycobacterium heckeshornense]MCV7036798.1 hypothetical protein [Mycobacterium heckeshornense]PIJ32258.1 hypothetical protein BMW24_018995 [Mycobacterium heckeshornense]BCO35619.1 hypothetical protein MHEC_20520 [Mycobacterium heckeshornense]BCQ08761.1 hypothetical protein JMUB5695_02199 [Mycobacterium heckeshornense]